MEEEEDRDKYFYYQSWIRVRIANADGRNKHFGRVPDGEMVVENCRLGRQDNNQIR